MAYEDSPSPVFFVTNKMPSKRKRNNEVVEQEYVSLDILPSDCWAKIFTFVTDYDLSSTIPLVCRSFSEICTGTDKYLWKPRCSKLWIDKVESSWKYFSTNDSISFHQKFLLSLKDARRSSLSVDEICSFTWGFRFKESAGEWWTSLDPYWASHGRQQMMRLFEEDGELSNPGPPDALNTYANQNNIRLHWRFTKTRRSLDGTVSRGQFLKINQWPSAGIGRSKNWGWIMQNQWVVYMHPAKDMYGMHEELEADVDRWV